MMPRIVLRPAAEADIEAAAAWLEEQSPRAAARARRVVLRNFRYAVFYYDTEAEVVVIACIHTSRHPRRWQARIPE